MKNEVDWLKIKKIISEKLIQKLAEELIQIAEEIQEMEEKNV